MTSPIAAEEHISSDDVAVLRAAAFEWKKTALEAVRQWKFRPGTLDGRPVAVIFNLRIDFKFDSLH